MEIKFKRVHTSKGLAISAVVLLAGVGLYFVNAALGFIFIACGALMLVLYRPAFKRVGDDTVLAKAAFDVSSSCKEQLTDYLAGKGDALKLQKPGTGGVVRLETFYSAKAGIVYAQLFGFSNYAYVDITGVVELRGVRAEKLISEINAFVAAS